MRNVTKCGYADKYKASKEPTCGCFVCNTNWRLKQLERENDRLKSLLGQAIKSADYASTCANGALYVANLSR